jgi:hypothetical protein
MSLGRPETPLLPWSKVNDSAYPEFFVMDAHKELFLSRMGPLAPCVVRGSPASPILVPFDSRTKQTELMAALLVSHLAAFCLL